MVPVAFKILVVDSLKTSRMLKGQHRSSIASFGRLLETHNLRPYPRPPESKPVFKQDSQVIYMHTKVSKGLVHNNINEY